jgi:hypothetical protein
MEHSLVIAAEKEISRAHYEYAWELLHLAPEPERDTVRAFAVKLKVHEARRDWRAGAALAARITPRHELPWRELAGRFRLAHSTALCTMGFLTEARSVLFCIFKVWPEGRQEVTAYPGIQKLWPSSSS